MGLFSRKKNEFDPRESYVPEITYDEDLPTTLLKATGVGSQDAKRIEVSYEDTTVVYIFDSGYLKSVEDVNEPLELLQRFYWVDKERYDEGKLTEIAALAQDNALPVFYSLIAAEYSDYLPLIEEILYAYSVTVMLKTKDRKITNLATDILLGTAENFAETLNYMSVDSRELSNLLSGLSEKEENEISLITKEPIRYSVLNLQDANFVPETDIDKIIYAAAESQSTLEDVKMLSQGFLFSAILHRISELEEQKIIEIDEPTRKLLEIADEEDALPSFDDELMDEEELFTDEPVEKVIPEAKTEKARQDAVGSDAFTHPEDLAEEDWEYSSPNNDVSDDGDFNFEELEEQEGTAHILDGFSTDMKRTLSRNEASKETIKEVSEWLKKNEELEEETHELDKEIKDLQVRYDETYHTFQYTAVDKTFNENEDISDAELDNIRTISNVVFESLHEAEEERMAIGLERKALLRKMIKTVSAFTSHDVQETVYKLEQKIEGIENVINKALHTAKDEERMAESTDLAISPSVDESIVNAEEKQDVNFVEPTFHAPIVEYSVEDTPLFYELAKTLGNPLKTEKE